MKTKDDKIQSIRNSYLKGLTVRGVSSKENVCQVEWENFFYLNLLSRKIIKEII